MSGYDRMILKFECYVADDNFVRLHDEVDAGTDAPLLRITVGAETDNRSAYIDEKQAAMMVSFINQHFGLQ